MNRRNFFVRTGAFLTPQLMPRRGGAQPGAETPLRVGSGTHTYEVHHDFLTLPDNLRYGDTQGLAQDSKGRIYVAHTVHPDSPKKDAIAVFDSKGKFLTSWGERFAGGAHGLQLRKEGKTEYLYHCDTAHRLVVKTTLDGTVVWEKSIPTETNVYTSNAPCIPTNVAFAPNGDFYVADGYGSHWIHRYDSAGNRQQTFGGIGSEPGKVNCPHGLFVDTRNVPGSGKEPRLVVADRANNRLQYLTLDGKHLGFVRDGIRQPCHFDIQEGLLLVPDLASVVTILDEQNRVVVPLGDGHPSNLRGRPRSEYIPGRFIHPHAAIFLKNRDILVAEWVPTGRITLLKRV